MSLRQKTIDGVFWSSAQTVAAKLVSFVGQIALAAILSPADFGLFSMAMTANLLCVLLQTSGVRDVLIKQRKNAHHLMPSAFWLCIALGLLSGVLTLCCIPVIQRFYQTEDVEKLSQLLIILAVQPVVAAVGVPSNAVLQGQYRFRELSIIGTCRIVFDVVTRITLALAGFGAFSFVIALVMGTAIQSIWSFLISRPSLKRPSIPIIWSLFRASSWIVGAEFFLIAFEFTDYAILSLFVNETRIGIYFLAYTLSNQIVFFFGANVIGVLYASITGMQAESEARMNVHWRVTRLISVWIIPISVAQILLAPTIVPALFSDQWKDAVWLVQILALGMVFRSHIWLAMNFLKAEGRLRMRVVASSCLLAGFACSVFAGATAGREVGVAVAVSAYYLVTAPLATWLACSNLSCVEIVNGVLRPASPVIAVFLVASHMTAFDLLIVSIAAIPLTLGLIRWQTNNEWREGIAILRRLIQKTISNSTVQNHA